MLSVIGHRKQTRVKQMAQTFGHGDYIEGYGSITGSYHTKTATVYICHILDEGYRYFERPL